MNKSNSEISNIQSDWLIGEEKFSHRRENQEMILKLVKTSEEEKSAFRQ